MFGWDLVFAIQYLRLELFVTIGEAASIEGAVRLANEQVHEAAHLLDGDSGVGLDVDEITAHDLYRILCHGCGSAIDRTDNTGRDLGYDDRTREMLAWMEMHCDCGAENEDDAE